MSAFESAIQQAHSAVEAVAGAVMTYRVGGEAGEPIVVTMVPGVTRHGGTNGAGEMVVLSRSRDFLVESADLIDGNGAAVVPDEGDVIEWIKGGVRRKYLVTRPEGAQGCWRWADHRETRRRVHTDFYDEEVVP
ncbi:MAG: hypothetical protein AAGI68_15990 [Planctomycetota bacterium]